jgi:CxxC motif-containing protein (DUF1111 family)
MAITPEHHRHRRVRVGGLALCAALAAGCGDGARIVSPGAQKGAAQAAPAVSRAQARNLDVQPLPPGTYRLVAVHSGHCVDVIGGSREDGAALVQAACDPGRAFQFFDIDAAGSGLRLRNRGSDKVVDIAAGSAADHARVQQWTDNGTGAQRFRIERVDQTDRYRVVNGNSGKCLAVAGAATAAGAALEQLACTGATSRLFHLVSGAPRVRGWSGQPLAPPLPPLTRSADYRPLQWAQTGPQTRYTLPDGTLVTHVGGRVRNRHAREPIENDSYAVFPPEYFERRTHEIVVYDNGLPEDPDRRVLTIVVRPQHYWYGTNFRHGFLGRRGEDPLEPTSVALYADNGGMKVLPGGVVGPTPLSNYATLSPDPGANYTPPMGPPGADFVLVKEIRTAANDGHRPLRRGDLVEFELGIFLAGNPAVIGRFNYYADALVYRAGSQGIVPWFRGPGFGVQRPLDSLALPHGAQSAGPWMTLHENASNEQFRMLMQASHNIAGAHMQPWVEGRRLLHTSFVSGRHSEESNTRFAAHAGKSAPRFSQTRCVDCHQGNGRSSPAEGAALRRLGVFVGVAASGAQQDDPRFGSRLQQGLFDEHGEAVDGREAELRIARYERIPGRFGDGTPYVLGKPVYELRDRAGNAIALPSAMSVRTAPSLVGLGLLEAVHEDTLERLVARQATDPDGIAGRLQVVRDPGDPAIGRVGRFGWKAGTATLAQQVSQAFNLDMGVSSPMAPQLECARGTAGAACRAVDDGRAKLTAADVDAATLYLALLGVPPRRHFHDPLQQDADARRLQEVVARGEFLFDTMRCTACHVPELTTGGHRFTELREQRIRPYTDLLLHDMGPELADTYVEGRARGSEWRTAPLWGIGTAAAIDPQVRYLHDGRAATLEEAILWHGGQGAAAKRRYEALAAADREAVVEFLRSL